MSSHSPRSSNILSVKSMISIFENQTYPVENEPSRLKRVPDDDQSRRHRTKSVGHINAPARRPSKRGDAEKNLELAHIEQEIQHLQRVLSNYRTYSKESHIYYQNQIFFLLTDLVNVESRNKSKIINKKSELIELLKRLNKGLIARLPSKERRSDVTTPKVTRVERVRPEKRREVVYEAPEVRPQVREEDVPAPSVKSLKEMFEKNTNEGEGTREYGKSSIVRTYSLYNERSSKFFAVNGNNEMKYVPYSERMKSFDEDSNVFVTTVEIPRTVSVDISENSVAVDETKEESEDEEKDEVENESNMSPDSLSGDESENYTIGSAGEGQKDEENNEELD